MSATSSVRMNWTTSLQGREEGLAGRLASAQRATRLCRAVRRLRATRSLPAVPPLLHHRLS
eukprot:scaffold65088_cov36-Tisochrysis_lutea.AAC.3